jgi:hypothetical protein
MNKTALGVGIIIAVLIAVLAMFKLGVFGEKTRGEIPDTMTEVPADVRGPQTFEDEVNSIDIGGDLEGDFAAPDSDIQAL